MGGWTQINLEQEPSENLEYDLDEPKILSQEFPWNSQKKSELVNISHK